MSMKRYKVLKGFMNKSGIKKKYINDRVYGHFPELEREGYLELELDPEAPLETEAEAVPLSPLFSSGLSPGALKSPPWSPSAKPSAKVTPEAASEAVVDPLSEYESKRAEDIIELLEKATSKEEILSIQVLESARKRPRKTVLAKVESELSRFGG